MNGETLELNFARPVAASTPAAESIHNGGLGFLPTLPPTKRCRQCLQLLSLSAFQKKTPGKFRHICKECYKPRKKTYAKAWYTKNRSYLNEAQKGYQARYRAARLQGRPPRQPCPKCGGTDIFWLRGKWNCAPCNRADYRKVTWARKNATTKAKDVARYTANIERDHGTALSAAYAQLHREHPQTRVRVPLEKLVMLSLRFQGRPLTYNNALRVIQLNRLSHQRTDNFGWSCSHCGTQSDDFRFFDVDHITPRSKKGHGRRANLQILCPNCHRRKTIIDLYPPLPELAPLSKPPST